MKRYVLLLFVCIALIEGGMAQTGNFNELCKKYKGIEGVTSFRFKGFGCFMASLLVGGEETRVGTLVRSCSSCQILIYDGRKKQEFLNEIKSFICLNALEELVSVKDHGDDVRVYAEAKEDIIRQFFITVKSGGDLVFLHLKGKFTYAMVQEAMKNVPL